MRIMLRFAFLVVICLLYSVNADKTFDNGDKTFTFASYYQENMILQMEPHRAVIWGYGTVGAIVNVSLIQDVYSTKVVAGPNKVGIWKVTLSSHAAGGPFTIQAVEDDNGLLSWILLKNILFGDVWICSGQSNMQFTMSMVNNSAEELALASKYPDIRVMTVAESQSDVPLDELKSIELPWSIPSEQSLGGAEWTYFSAVCWLYGRYLYDTLKLPIGLVSTTWGGTPVEAWSSTRALEKCGLNKQSAMKDAVDKTRGFPEKFGVNPQNNSVLWNAMVHPLLNMTIKGTIWYQGEQNVNYHNKQYACSFPSMISDWRDSWYEGTGGQTHQQFPFGFVQIAPYYDLADTRHYSLIRWRQTANYGYVPNPKMPNTFMSVPIDLGDKDSPYGSIHPRDKQDVASRLTRGGLNVAYMQHIEYQGPFPESVVRSGSGDVVVTYPNSQNLVVTEEGNFEVCCSYSTCDIEAVPPNANWVWAPITSSTHRSVTISALSCTANGGQAAQLRYAWKNAPCQFKKCSVYNDLGLPGQPFYLKVDDM